MNTKNNLAILVGITAVAILFASAVFIIYKNTPALLNWEFDSTDQLKGVVENDRANIEWQCLNENEEAGYYDKLGRFGQTWVPKTDPLEVIVRDKKNKEEIKKVMIDDVMNSYHPAEVIRCAIYVLREFNFDAKSFKMLPGYNVALWRYGFDNESEKLIIFREKGTDNDYDSSYSYDFRVSPDEKYVALIKSYGGQDDYSLVIKDLKTKEDAFILTMNEFLLRYPDIEGSFDLIGWKSDGRYFWADIMTGAPTPGYLRVDSRDWSYEAWETPEKALGGFEPNYMTGWMPYAPSAVWTGMVEMDEAVRADAKAKGQISPLYIYNLFTKKQIKIDEVQSDPIWNFGPPTWLSDAELEYQMPDGEKKTYKLK